MAPARRASARARGRTVARLERAVAAAPVARSGRAEPLPLSEELPHAHIVCRVCGRIQGMELSELDRHVLTQIAAGRPDGWSVERIAFSLAGACQRCREGPSAP